MAVSRLIAYNLLRKKVLIKHGTIITRKGGCNGSIVKNKTFIFLLYLFGRHIRIKAFKNFTLNQAKSNKQNPLIISWQFIHLFFHLYLKIQMLKNKNKNQIKYLVRRTFIGLSNAGSRMSLSIFSVLNRIKGNLEC